MDVDGVTTTTSPATTPLAWLKGTWRCDGGAKGSYPTIEDFEYAEEVRFTEVGQPMLNYSSVSWHSVKKYAMHQESGFLKIKPGTNQVSFLVSHNFGLTTIEEGEVREAKLHLSSTSIERCSFSKPPRVTKLERRFTLTDSTTLVQEVYMQTDNTPLTKHLHVQYKKL